MFILIIFIIIKIGIIISIIFLKLMLMLVLLDRLVTNYIFISLNVFRIVVVAFKRFL